MCCTYEFRICKFYHAWKIKKYSALSIGAEQGGQFTPDLPSSEQVSAVEHVAETTLPLQLASLLCEFSLSSVCHKESIAESHVSCYMQMNWGHQQYQGAD